jgi:hypothetical protein
MKARWLWSLGRTVTALQPALGLTHGGGLDADGCHTNRMTGEYHCHRAPNVLPYPPSAPSQPFPTQRLQALPPDDARASNNLMEPGPPCSTGGGRELKAALARCAEITVDDYRLVCFDALGAGSR